MDNIMKEWIDTWEKEMGNTMDEMVKSQEFMKNFLTTYEPALEIQKNIRESREKFFEMFGVSSKEDVEGISQQVQDLEIKLADLTEMVEETLDNQKEIIKAINNMKTKAPEAKKTVVKKTTTKKTTKAKK
ncbi:MAG: hypothetical protein C0601_05675 [Candidatus Muiribacterium halophilum]|uniref:Poly(3-hydroxyalkanoate) polymerase subunit PhaE n=1 Tax=Muiribacterium halophilum TaxID=2053465 RepID=A0A2N5ZHI7_MUIH1|nr:MAG: hypothetical protein C0601_05675 [Candidatus Muirbacterium halophilum]